MVVRGKVRHGAAGDLRRTATELRRINREELPDAQRTGVDDALKELPRDLTESAGVTLPTRYGATVLGPAMRYRTLTRKVSSSGSRFQIAIYARGPRDFREVPRINRGMLRHPVFRRRRKDGSLVDVWVGQRVKSGFVDRPIARLEGRLYTHVDKHVRVVVDEFNRGR